MIKDMKFEKQKGVMPVLQICTPDMLAVDPSYQRATDNASSQILIKRIAQNWDWNLCHPLIVSHRLEGGLFVIDGQHRLNAAKLRGDIQMLPCVIIACDGPADEARNFSKLNQQRKPLSALEIFRADLAAGDPVATHIFGVLEQQGLTLAQGSNNQHRPRGAIGNVHGLKTCLRDHGEVVFRASIELLAKAFGHQTLQYAGTIYPGIAEIARHEIQRWSRLGKDGPWNESIRSAAAVGFLKSRSQEDWYLLIHAQKAKDPNANLRTCAIMAFLALWTENAK